MSIARATISLARLWRDQGKLIEANDLLTPVYNGFTEGFDTTDLMDGKALLGELHRLQGDIYIMPNSSSGSKASISQRPSA
jgi:predicted ATPase